MKKKIAIIGAGLGGLVAANLLAKKGHSVTLFESHTAPGGYVAGFWRKGFYFESGTLSVEGHALFSLLKELDLWDQIPFVKQRIRFLSSKFDATPTSFEELKKMVFDAFPEEKEIWMRYFATIEPIAFSLFGTGFWKKLRLFYYFLKYHKISQEKFVAQFFQKGSLSSTLAKGIFCYPKAPAFMIPISFASLFYDYWTSREGLQSVADLLAKNFQKLGGKLQLSSFVDKVITEKEKVTGVQVKEKIEEAEIVIAACDYKNLFLNLIDDPSKIDKEKIEKSEVSEAVFVVYLALKTPNEELKKALKEPYVSYFHEKEEEIFSFETTSFSLYSPSLHNADLAPKGKSSLMIEAFLPKSSIDDFLISDRKLYLERKERAKKSLIEQATLILPKLKEWIEWEDAATPHTFERYTHNSRGASSGWSWDVEKKFYPKIGRLYIQTPIENLFLGSCWANTFGGIPGTVLAAKACVKKIDP